MLANENYQTGPYKLTEMYGNSFEASGLPPTPSETVDISSSESDIAEG